MIKILIILAVFLFTAPVLALEGRPFCYQNSSVEKEGLISQLEGKKLNVPIPLFLSRIEKVLGKKFRSKDEFIAFVRSDEVKVRPCDWKKGEVRVEHVNRRGSWDGYKFGTLSRECYTGEHVLVYQDKAFLSLICCNPVSDQRVRVAAVTPTPKPETPPAPAIVPPLKTEEKPKEVVKTKAKKCEWVRESNSLPPVGTYYGFMFGGFGTTGISATHRAEYCK